MTSTFSRRFRPSFESLESRDLMDGSGGLPPPFVDPELITASLSNGVLSVIGTRGADTIAVRQELDQLVVVGRNTSDPFATEQRFSFGVKSVSQLQIEGRASDDTIRVASAGPYFAEYGAISLPCEMSGGPGNDFLWGGAGPDLLYGDDGLDKLFGNAGRDWLYGDADEDILDGTAGEDVLEGGTGADQLNVLFDIDAFTHGRGQSVIGASDGQAPGTDTLAVRVDLYPLVAGYIQPVVTNVQKVTRSLQGVIDFFEQRVPVLADHTPIKTFGDLIDAAGGHYRDFATAINQINGLNLGAEATGVVEAGTFTLTDRDQVASVVSAPSLALPDYYGAINNLGLHFPLIEDRATLANLVVGHNVELFAWQMLELSVDVSLPQKMTIVTPIGIPVTLTLTETLTLGARATFGMDLAGIRSGHLLDGFFVANPAVTLILDITGTAGVGIPGFQAGVYASVTGQISVNPVDPTPDGKFRLSDILAIDGFFVSDQKVYYAVGVFIDIPFKDDWKYPLAEGYLSLN